jgi:KUP system potassium uptake protein
VTNSRGTLIAPVAALGIVFGDIGTSPLYAINELLYKTHLHQSKDDIVGSISLVIWLLTIVICIKYVSIVLRADNDEQGGVFALLALLSRHKTRTAIVLTSVLVFAAGMLLGDGVITPAISVLSAVEGMSVASSEFEHMTVPITLVILLGLFAFQKNGTDKIGKIFGPVMLAWFGFLAVSGANSLAHNTDILAALNPLYAIRFIDELTPSGVALVLGAAILVVTGGEALFADLGHIGKRPIRQSWFSVVYTPHLFFIT